MSDTPTFARWRWVVLAFVLVPALLARASNQCLDSLGLPAGVHYWLALLEAAGLSATAIRRAAR